MMNIIAGFLRGFFGEIEDGIIRFLDEWVRGMNISQFCYRHLDDVDPEFLAEYMDRAVVAIGKGWTTLHIGSDGLLYGDPPNLHGDYLPYVVPENWGAEDA